MDSAVRTLRQDVKLIGLIASAHALSHFYQLVIAVLFPLIKDDFGVSYAALGATVAVFYIVSGVCQTIAGFLVDRLDARRVLIAGLALCSAGVFIAGMARSYEMLVLAAFVAGVGNSVFHPADFAILNTRVDTRRLGYAFSFHGIGGTLGWALAPVFSYAMSALYGWHVALMVSAALGVVMIALVLAGGKALEIVPGKSPPKAEAGGRLADDVRLLTQAPVLMCFLYFLLLAAALIGVQTFGVAGLVAFYEAPAAIASAALTAFLIGGACGILFGGYVAGRTQRHDLVAAGGMFAAALFVLALAFGALPLALLAPVLAMAGFLSGMTNPSRDLLVRAAVPKGATGKVYGFVYSGLDVGSMAVPVLYGWLLDSGQPQAVFYAVFALLLLTVLTVLQLPGRPTQAARVPVA